MGNARDMDAVLVIEPRLDALEYGPSTRTDDEPPWNSDAESDDQGGGSELGRSMNGSGSE
jgi:hypothetical protein